LLLFVLLLTTLGPEQALALPDTPQTTAPLTDATLEELMNVKVYSASRYGQTISEAPASVTVINRDEILQYGYRTLADILRSVPGFYIAYDRLYDYVGVRGFANPGDYNTRILLLVDGHRLNDSVFEQAMVGTEFPVDVDVIERVEVIRGPASSIYGTNAIFGVVNVITRTADRLRGLEVSADAASLNTYRRRASYGGRLLGIDTVLSATFLDSKGHNQLFFPEFNNAQNNFGVANHTDSDRYTDLLATLSARGLRLQAVYGSRDKQDPTGAWDTAFDDPRNHVIDTHAYLDLRYEHSIGSWQWMARSYCDKFGEDGFYITQMPQESSVINRDFSRGEQWGGELQASKSIHHRHKLTGGIEYRDQFRQEVVNYDVSPQQLYLNLNVPSYVFGAYLQGEFKLRDNLSLTAGIREDYNQQIGANTNPRLALTYNPWTRTNFKVIYGTAFRSPSIYEQYYASLNFDSDHKLSSEAIRAFEGAWEQQLSPSILLSASVFHNRMRNFIEFSADSDNSCDFRNIDDATAMGGELELRGRWSSGITGHASYSYQSAQGGAAGQWLVGSPRHLAKLNLTLPLYHQKLAAGIEALYTGKRLTLNGSQVNGYAVLNLTILSRKLAGHLDLSASLYNLLNQTYSDPGAQQHIQDTLQQDGRSFRVKLVWSSRSE
jgi:iron complex outermembrane receptor protein